MVQQGHEYKEEGGENEPGEKVVLVHGGLLYSFRETWVLQMLRKYSPSFILNTVARVYITGWKKATYIKWFLDGSNYDAQE